MKKISFKTDLLKPALKKLGQAVSTNVVIPATRNILMRVSSGKAELITTDLELTIQVTMDVEAPDEFECLIPFDYLQKIVGENPASDINIQLKGKYQASINSGEDVYEMGSLEKVEGFPTVPSVPKKNVLQLDEKFIDCLKMAMLSTSKEEARPAMCRALLDLQEKKSYLASTDAYFLYRHSFDLPVTEPEKIQFSAKMAKAIEGFETMELSWTAKIVAMKSGNIVVWSKRFDDTFPAYGSIIPDYPPNLSVSGSMFTDCLRKACISASAVKSTVLDLKSAEGFIVFDVNDPELNRKIHVKMPAAYKGNMDKITINAKKMLTILEQSKGEDIKVHLMSANKAILVSCDEDPDYLGLLMPVM